MTTFTVDPDRITITDPECSALHRYPKRCSQCPPRSAVIVVDGEPMSVFYNRVHNGDHEIELPEQIRVLTEPCETCDGKGKVPGMNHGYGDLLFTCLECHRGKPTFTLHMREFTLHMRDGQPFRPVRHDLGDGWTIIDVLPIVDVPGDDYPDDAPGRFAYVSASSNLREVDRSDPSDTFICSAPPAAKPGKFVVFAEQKPTCTCYSYHEPMNTGCPLNTAAEQETP